MSKNRPQSASVVSAMIGIVLAACLACFPAYIYFYCALRRTTFYHLGTTTHYYATQWQATLFTPAATIEGWWYDRPTGTTLYKSDGEE